MTTDTLSANLDDPCHSLRDFLGLLAARRQEREPIGVAIDLLLEMVGE